MTIAFQSKTSISGQNSESAATWHGVDADAQQNPLLFAIQFRTAIILHHSKSIV
jgi:hypothetical protein